MPPSTWPSPPAETAPSRSRDLVLGEPSPAPRLVLDGDSVGRRDGAGEDHLDLVGVELEPLAERLRDRLGVEAQLAKRFRAAVARGARPGRHGRCFPWPLEPNQPFLVWPQARNDTTSAQNTQRG